MVKFFKLLSLATIILYSQIFAQKGTISGRVTDNKNVPLVGVNVFLKDLSAGTATNMKGNFSLKDIPFGKHSLKISMVGYRTITKNIFLNKKILNLNLRLTPTSITFEDVIVTASKHEQKLLESPVSAEVINPEIISKKNFTKFDDLLRYAPGVNVTLDQVSIRGSSGYSRGAGTRVLIAIDGVPIFTGDTGEIIWELVPITDIERVEIIKGAASSLYGSTAIGGVINIITKKISRKMLTFIKSYVGAYDKPRYSEWVWSHKTRTFNGFTIANSNKIGKFGYAVSLSKIHDMSYRQNEGKSRFSGYLKARYNFNNNLNLTFLANGFIGNRETFNFWKNSREALKPPESDIGQKVRSERSLYALIFNDKLSGNISLNSKLSFYRSFWKDESESANRSSSNLYRGEVQSNFKLNENWFLVTGAEFTSGIVKSNIFGKHTSFGFAAYSQMEYKLNFPLKLTLGARYDYNKISTIKGEGSISPKFGLNYKLNESTYLRANFLNGFRAPSLAEAFTSTVTSGIKVKPNPKLKSESNYGFELGINHSFNSNFNIDFALFQNEYFDMIEPSIDLTDGEITFQNVTRARIQGAEAIVKYQIPRFNIKTRLGYTYLWTRDLNKQKALKYRPRHLAYLQLEYTPSIFTFGLDFRYWSKVEEIDFELVELGLVPNGDTRVEVFVLDLRAGVNLYSLSVPANIYLNLNNVLNYNYVEMIGNISPIRNISLNLEFLF